MTIGRPIGAPLVKRTMRILSEKALRELVLYSPAHVDRLEKSGRFPKRVRLGPCRVGWVESEVLERVQACIDDRKTTAA